MFDFDTVFCRRDEVMKKIDFKKSKVLNLIGGIVFFLMGLSYIFIEEYFKGILEVGVGIFLLSPVILKYVKKK